MNRQLEWACWRLLYKRYMDLLLSPAWQFRWDPMRDPPQKDKGDAPWCERDLELPFYQDRKIGKILRFSNSLYSILAVYLIFGFNFKSDLSIQAQFDLIFPTGSLSNDHWMVWACTDTVEASFLRDRGRGVWRIFSLVNFKEKNVKRERQMSGWRIVVFSHSFGKLYTVRIAFKSTT